MAVITVSREYGSRGEQIAQQVAKSLGYSYCDKELLADVARAADTTEAEIRRYDEKDERGLRGFLKKLFVPNNSPSMHHFSYPGAPPIGTPPNPVATEPALDADEVTSFYRDVIEELWQRGNVLIVGRGSQMILAAKSDTVHVRFIAPINDRAETVMKDEDITLSDALEKIETIDAQRAHYLKHYYDADWADAKHYHLVLNTSFMSIAQAVKTIIAAVRHQNETKQKETEWVKPKVSPTSRSKKIRVFH